MTKQKITIEELDKSIETLQTQLDALESSSAAIRNTIAAFKTQKNGIKLGIEVGDVVKYNGKDVRISSIGTYGFYFNAKTKSGAWSKKENVGSSNYLHK